MSEAPLLDWAEATARRDEGMAAASEAQERDDPGWGIRFYAAIVVWAAYHNRVFRDDVMRTFPELPKHPNAIGAVWQRAIKDGVIARTGESRQSADRVKHRHWYPVYASLICPRPAA